MKNLTLLRVAAAWLLVLFLSSYLPAQTNISGAVSGVWNLAGSPYLIVGDANVPAGSSLQIEAGVVVQFTGEYLLEVFGNIQASSVEFKSTSTYSKGLHITNGEDTCRFAYCTFKDFQEHTVTGNSEFKGGAVYATNTKLAMDHCTFTNNGVIPYIVPGYYCLGYGGAICCEGCSGYMQNSAFTNNRITASVVTSVTGKGGAIYNSGNIVIRSNQITSNYIDLQAHNNDGGCGCGAEGGGIYTNGIVENNTISNNYCATDAWAFAYESWASAGAGSLGGGVYGGSSIKNNFIHDNDCSSEADAGTGMGYDPSSSADSKGGGVYQGSTLENNIIYNPNLCIRNLKRG
jgi:hypothetical protein